MIFVHQFSHMSISISGFYTRSQISASFTADGQHIISASEDCNVSVWSHVSHDIRMSNHVKSIWSCERFFSTNASIAIPWHGLESSYRISMTSDVFQSQQVNGDQSGVTENESKCHLQDSDGDKSSTYHHLGVLRWAMISSQSFCQRAQQHGQRRNFPQIVLHLACPNPGTSSWRHLARTPPMPGVR